MQTSVSSVTLDKPKLKDFKTAEEQGHRTASGRKEKEMERKGNVGFLGRSMRQCACPGPGLVMTERYQNLTFFLGGGENFL